MASCRASTCSRRYRAEPQTLRLLAPFDPLVWDRRRFERLWGWAYRFEAYTPPAKRTMGHYALPLLWGEQVIGWANLKVVNGALAHELGFVRTRPRSAAFRLALEEALHRMEVFLRLRDQAASRGAGESPSSSAMETAG